MPYKSVSELPPGVKDALPMHGQQIYMAAYNSALENTCKDAGERQKECCAKVAWAAVKNVYKQDAKGNWVEAKEDIKKKEFKEESSIQPLIFQLHDSILNTLDRQSAGTYLSADSFKNAEAWNGINVVFAQDHPKDFDAFIKSPESEAQKIDGRIIGTVKDARIDMEGHPRLMATLDINDAVAEELIKDGRLSISTAFKVALKDGRTVGPVTPNHVLAFEETNKDQPGDKGAFILNKEDVLSEEDEHRFMKWLKRKETIADVAGEINMVEKIEEKPTESETELALKNKDAEIESIKTEMRLKDEKLAALESELQKFKEDKENAEWVSFKEKYIPPGWIHKEEDEKKIREEYKSDKFSLLMRAVDSSKSTGATKEEGLQFMAGNKDESSYEEKMKKIGIPRIDFELREVD